MSKDYVTAKNVRFAWQSISTTEECSYVVLPGFASTLALLNEPKEVSTGG